MVGPGFADQSGASKYLISSAEQPSVGPLISGQKLSFWRCRFGKNTYCCVHQSVVSEHCVAMRSSTVACVYYATFQIDRKNKILYFCGQAEIEKITV